MNSLNDDVNRLHTALRIGPVKNCGGILMDDNGESLGFDQTRMYHAVQELGRRGVVVERTDSGGLPTWEIKA